jgi:hypothetical protein
MKAAQLMALQKYLPLIWRDRVDVSHEHWQFLLHLSALVNLEFAPVFTPGMIGYMSTDC